MTYQDNNIGNVNVPLDPHYIEECIKKAQIEKGYLWPYVRETLRDRFSKNPLWAWARGRFVISGGFLQRVTNAEFYNVFDHPRIYLKLANLNVNDNKAIESFVDNYGLLGLAGWYYEIRTDPCPTLLPRRSGFSDEKLFVKSQVGFGSGTRVALFVGDLDEASFINNYYGDAFDEFSKIDKDEFHSTLLNLKLHYASYMIISREPITEFQREARRLQSVVSLYQSINSKIRENLIESLLSVSLLWIPPEPDEHVEGILYPIFTKEELDLESIERLVNIGHDILEQILCETLSGIAIRVEDSKFFYDYKPGPPSLLPALYFQLATDAVGGHPVRQCKNLNCNRFFSPSRADNIYCCPTCKNAQKQRAYRARKCEK
jgi:hypothetical protein